MAYIRWKTRRKAVSGLPRYLDLGVYTPKSRYPYVRKRRNSDKILLFRINPTKLYML